MAASLGDLVVSIAADIAKLEMSMTRAEHITAQTSKKIDKAMGLASDAIAGVAAGFFTFKAVDAFTRAINDATEFAAKMHETAISTGTSAAELSKYRTMAEQSGVSIDTVGKGLQALSKAMYETAQGTGKARDVFAALKLEVRDGQGNLKKSSDFMREVSGALSGMGDKTQQVAAAQKILKGTGAELLPFMHELAAAGKLEAEISDEQAFAADRYKDKVIELEGVKRQWALMISQQVTPVLEAYTRLMIESRTEAGGLNDTTRQMAEQNQIRQWAINGGIAIAMVVDGLRYVAAGIKTIGEAIAVVAVFFVQSFQNIGTAIGIASAMLKSFGTVLEGIVMMQRGQFSDGFALIKKGAEEIASGVGQMRDRFSESFKEIGNAVDGFKDKFAETADEFGKGSIVEKFLKQIQAVGEGFKKVGKEVGAVTPIIKKFEKDAVDALTVSLAKEIAQLQTNIEHLQRYGVETKATEAATTALQLAEMERNGTLAEHARRTGESVEATKARIMEMAREKDGLVIGLQLEREYAAALKQHRDSLAASVQSIVDQIEQQRIANETYGMAESAVTAYAIAQLEAKKASLLAVEGAELVIKALDVQIEKLRQLGALQREGEGLRNMVTMWQQAANFAGEFAKVLVNNVGDAVDWLKNKFKELLAEMITIFATRWVLNLGASITGNSALSVLAGQVGQGTAAGNIMNLFSGGSSAYSAWNALGPGMGGAYSGFMSGWSSGSLGSSFVGPPATLANGSVGAGANAGSFMASYGWIITSVAAVVAAMFANDRFFSQGWRADNADSTARAQSRFLAAGLPGPLEGDRLMRALGFNDRWASLLSGSSLFMRMFGRGATHEDAYGFSADISGRQGTFRGWQDFSQPGGTFRSDHRWTERNIPLSPEMDRFFSGLMNRVNGLVDSFGRLVGVDPSTALAGFSRTLSFQASDNGEFDAEAFAENISTFFGEALQDQVVTVFEAAGRSRLAEYVRALTGSGEELTAQIQDLATAMLGLEQLSQGRFGLEISIETLMDMQAEGETLTQTFQRVGGAWTQLVNQFVSRETVLNQAQTDLEALYDSLADAGYELPTTREGWLDVMRSIDQTTESGRELFARMMALAPAFDAVSAAVQQQMDSFDALMSRIRPGYAAGLQQGMLSGNLSDFMAANSWTQGMSAQQVLEALRTITREDFSAYSRVNRDLILSILTLDSTLNATNETIAGSAGPQFSEYQGIDAYSSAMEAGRAMVEDFERRYSGVIGTGDTLLDRLQLRRGFQADEMESNTARLAQLRDLLFPTMGESWVVTHEAAALTEANRLLGLSQGEVDDWIEEIMDLNEEFGNMETAEAIFELNRWREEQLELVAGNAEAMLEIEEEYGQRREDILEGEGDVLDELEERIERARDSIMAWRENMLLSDKSPLTIQQRFTEAFSQYDRVSMLARAGDAESLEQYTQVADELLAEALAMFGRASPEYQALFDRLYNDSLFLGLGMEKPIIDVWAEQRPILVDGFAHVEASVREENQALRDEVIELREQMLAVKQEVHSAAVMQRNATLEAAHIIANARDASR